MAPAAALLALGGTALIGAAVGLGENGASVSIGVPPPVAAPAANAAAAPASPADPVEPSAPAGSVGPTDAAALSGIWSGTLDDPDTEPTAARLVVAGPDRGPAVELPDLGCAYTGSEMATGADGTASSTLRLDGEPRAECVATAVVAVRSQGPDQVRYDVVESCDDGECGPRRASGILDRQ